MQITRFLKKVKKLISQKCSGIVWSVVRVTFLRDLSSPCVVVCSPVQSAGSVPGKTHLHRQSHHTELIPFNRFSLVAFNQCTSTYE